MKFFPTLLLLSTAAIANDRDILIVTGDFPNCQELFRSEVEGLGWFTSVDSFDARVGTPEASLLANYDALLVFSNVPFQDRALLGDRLADYYDQGGGVVVSMFGNADTNMGLSGRWVAQNYGSFLPIGFLGFDGPHTLGTVHQPGHFLMQGVETFDGGPGSWRPLATNLLPGSTRIASWSDGSILAAIPNSPRIVDLGWHPGSYGACGSGGWDPTTDGWVMLRNALMYACLGDNLGQSYCGPAVPNSSGLSSEIRAIGSVDVASNDLRLLTTGLPVNQFGMYINSRLEGLFHPPQSQGVLCVGPAIGRYNHDVMATGASGWMYLELDLPNTPTPFGPTSILSGETWRFQTWHRDNNPDTTSNFSDAVRVTFQ